MKIIRCRPTKNKVKIVILSFIHFSFQVHYQEFKLEQLYAHLSFPLQSWRNLVSNIFFEATFKELAQQMDKWPFGNQTSKQTCTLRVYWWHDTSLFKYWGLGQRCPQQMTGKKPFWGILLLGFPCLIKLWQDWRILTRLIDVWLAGVTN
jgi:hypothetical protein